MILSGFPLVLLIEDFLQISLHYTAVVVTLMDRTPLLSMDAPGNSCSIVLPIFQAQGKENAEDNTISSPHNSTQSQS